MYMKKFLLFLVLSVFAVVLVACGSGEEEGAEESADAGEETEESAETEQDSSEEASEEGGTLSVAASPAPHAEILEEAATILEEDGIELDVDIVNDYTTPNRLLADEEVDANFFQHTPYLDGEVESHDYDLVSAGNVHIEPMAVYSQDHDSLEDIPDRSTIRVTNIPAEEGRFLSFFVDSGLVEIEDGIILKMQHSMILARTRTTSTSTIRRLRNYWLKCTIITKRLSSSSTPTLRWTAD